MLLPIPSFAVGATFFKNQKYDLDILIFDKFCPCLICSNKTTELMDFLQLGAYFVNIESALYSGLAPVRAQAYFIFDYSKKSVAINFVQRERGQGWGLFRNSTDVFGFFWVIVYI